MANKKGRGFAGMDDAKKRQIASKGGKAAHQKGTAHEFTAEEARVAGRKGGQAAHQKGTAHRFTREEARAAGRKGGQAAHHRGVSRTTTEPRDGSADGNQNVPAGVLHEQAPSNFEAQPSMEVSSERMNDAEHAPHPEPQVMASP
jgi:general stress protein YciG